MKQIALADNDVLICSAFILLNAPIPRQSGSNRAAIKHGASLNHRQHYRQRSSSDLSAPLQLTRHSRRSSLTGWRARIRSIFSGIST